MSSNVGWTKKLAKAFAKAMNSDTTIAEVIRQDYWTPQEGKPNGTYEWIVEVRKRGERG